MRPHFEPSVRLYNEGLEQLSFDWNIEALFWQMRGVDMWGWSYTMGKQGYHSIQIEVEGITAATSDTHRYCPYEGPSSKLCVVARLGRGHWKDLQGLWDLHAWSEQPQQGSRPLLGISKSALGKNPYRLCGSIFGTCFWL